jgi:DNA repair protein RAD5
LYFIQNQELSGKPGHCPVCRYGPITENDLLDINKNNETTSGASIASSSTNNNITTDDDSSLKLSAKLGALLRHLNQLRQEDEMLSEKCVVFSQL